MAESKPRLFVDGFGAIPEGMNSGLVPQLISSNQLSMATNGTVRGGYIKNRPSVNKQTLTFIGGLITQTRFETGIWQGGCFFISEYGERGFVVSINGRIFFVVLKGDGFEVRDVTPQTNGIDDPNSTGNPIAWLWQAERWMIINDGQSLPIFFDGQTSRRSRGPAQTVGTLSVLFNAPAIGGSINITLAAPYTGPFNETIFIGSALYQVNASPSAYTVTLRNRTETPGGIVAAGTLLQIQDNLIGLLATASSPICGTFGGIPQCTWALDIALPRNGTISGITQLIGVRLSGTNYFYGTAFGVDHVKAFGNFGTLPIGTAIYNGYPHNAGFAGTTTAPFTIPAVGADVDVTINAAYTGALPQTVIINGGVYDIIATNNDPVPSAIINVTNITDVAGTVHNPGDLLTTVPEMQIGRMGAYGMGRNWYSLPDGRSFRATDIVGGSSGSPALKNRDAVLKETENSYLFGGGDFIIPGNIGDIRAMWFTAILDTSLGQGPLQVGTSTSIFTCRTPVDRTEWATITNPILTEALKGKGPLGQYATILVNSDTIFRARREFASMVLARRDFDTLGNTPLSREVQRVLDGDDESLAPNCTEIQFDNRVLLGCLAVRGPLGIYHTGIIALNNDPVSTMRQKSQSVYDGLWTGLQAFQMVAGSFNEVDRAFAFCFESFSNTISLFEILKTDEADFDNDTGPITMSFESAALFKGSKDKGQFEFCDLMDGEIYLADMRGFIYVEVWHRPAFSKCWQPWISFPLCADNTIGVRPKQYRAPIGLGYPSLADCDQTNNSKWVRGLNHQVRIQITGSCTFMGALFKAAPADMPSIAKIDCRPLCDGVVNTTNCKTCDEQGPCLEFPLVTYNLNANKSYTNLALAFEVTCASGTVVTVSVPAGIINYTLPFPPGFEGPYPPLVLGCVNGVVVRTLPNFATQDQIDVLVNEMITVCARAYAEAHAVCPTTSISNDQVVFTHTCGEDEVLTFNGTLPGWIFLDADNGQLIGQAGTFTGDTKAEATADAQAQLDAFAEAALTSGDLFCEEVSSGPSVVQVNQETSGWAALEDAMAFVEVGGVIYGLGDDFIYTSTDGVSWTPLAAQPYNAAIDLTYGEGLFAMAIASGNGVFGIATSPDCVTWTDRNTAGSMASVTYGNGKFVAVGAGGRISDSLDGITWSNTASGTNTYTGVTFGGGRFSACGRTSGSQGFNIYSADGITWLLGNIVGSSSFLSTRYIDTPALFITVGTDCDIYTSPDAITWTLQAAPVGAILTEDLASVGGGNGVLIIGGSFFGGNTNVYISLDSGVTFNFLRNGGVLQDSARRGVYYSSIANVINVGYLFNP